MRDGVTQDAGSDDDDTDDELDSEDLHSVDALEDQYLLLEEEVANLVADVHDLALYTKLNITGFMKILKVRHKPVANISAFAYRISFSQKHDVGSAGSLAECKASHKSTETNKSTLETHIHPRLSGEAAFLQV